LNDTILTFELDVLHVYYGWFMVVARPGLKVKIMVKVKGYRVRIKVSKDSNAVSLTSKKDRGQFVF